MTPDETQRLEKRHARIMELAQMVVHGVVEGTKGHDDGGGMAIEVLYVALLSAITGELVNRRVRGRGLTGFPLTVRGDFFASDIMQMELVLEIDAPADAETDGMGAPPSMARH